MVDMGSKRKYQPAVALGRGDTDPDHRSEAAAAMARRLAEGKSETWRRKRARAAANARWSKRQPVA